MSRLVLSNDRSAVNRLISTTLFAVAGCLSGWLIRLINPEVVDLQTGMPLLMITAAAYVLIAGVVIGNLINMPQREHLRKNYILSLFLLLPLCPLSTFVLVDLATPFQVVAVDELEKWTAFGGAVLTFAFGLAFFLPAYEKDHTALVRIGTTVDRPTLVRPAK